MTAEQKGSRGFNILDQIQVRRSQRFSTAGDRFGAQPKPSPETLRERELKRLRIVEERRVKEMCEVLGAALGMTGDEYRTAVEATFIDQQ